MSAALNIDLLRSFAAIVASGSLSRTAEQMRVAQSTLTRQVQSLEHELGGKLLERSHSGVALTAAGHTLYESLQTLLPQLDEAFARARTRARGQSSSLRIGYILSAASEYLNPALAEVRARHPEVKVNLRDLSPGEQVAALRSGDLDVALLGNAGTSLTREFFVRRLVSLPLAVGFSEKHPLAERAVVRLADLRREVFVGAKEEDVPGHNQWVIQLCRRARFRPRFVEDAESLTHSFSLLVAENAVTLVPASATRTGAPGVVFRPLEGLEKDWDLMVAWQRGKTPEPVRALVDALTRTAARKSPKR